MLNLHAAPGMSDWTGLKASDPTVLEEIPSPKSAQAKGVTVGEFKALKAGTSDITAYATPLCSPGTACPALAAVYRLAVTVVPKPSGSGEP